MAGILSLYAAVTQIEFPGTHPHGIGNAWSWLARILNLKPKRITAQLVLSFLQVAGYRLLQVYNRQFRKMLLLIKEEVLQRLPQESLASATRLQLFVMDYEQAGGVIAKPKGLI
jgi:nucleoporin GLE1